MDPRNGKGAPWTGHDVRVRGSVEVVRAFRNQLKAMSDKYCLTIVHEFEGRPFMNAEASALFGTKWQTTWVHLREMVELASWRRGGTTAGAG